MSYRDQAAQQASPGASGLRERTAQILGAGLDPDPLSRAIDLVSILPFYLSFFIVLDLRFLRVLRLLQIFKRTDP